ncbi:MAG: helix-turn-helix transcriptional regulator [Elusimicrobiota bacterium]
MKKKFTLKDMEKELFKTPKAREKYETEFRQLQIAHQIAELREEYKMSQKDLAVRLHTKQQVISRLEQDTYKPSLTTLEKLAEIFHKRLEIKFV